MGQICDGGDSCAGCARCNSVFDGVCVEYSASQQANLPGELLLLCGNGLPHTAADFLLHQIEQPAYSIRDGSHLRPVRSAERAALAFSLGAFVLRADEPTRRSVLHPERTELFLEGPYLRQPHCLDILCDLP